ncbi:sensor histidine kinase [Thalassovita sp.]|uniref:sensor histidine kinase n=1 Tax=Thalassovita sp. TaxID=1979401 RepID=UPI0028818434|nr:sensor histidine kinase [Thalassovita sp.]MDF1803688.1 sensor histidine kinase [Thalassovita sp.]
MALAEGIHLRDTGAKRDGDVVLGDEFVAPNSTVEKELRARRARRGFFTLNRSPLTRKIITFNLIALNVLVAGVLLLNSSRDSLVGDRADALIAQAELVSDVIEAQMPQGAPVSLISGDGVDVASTLSGLDLRKGVEVYVFDTTGGLIASDQGRGVVRTNAPDDGGSTLISDALARVWDRFDALINGPRDNGTMPTIQQLVGEMVPPTVGGGSQIETGLQTAEGSYFAAATPIMQNGQNVGVVALTSAAGEIDKLVRGERERILQMFLIATLVSIGLSIVLASTIANPLADLAAAAELGGARDRRNNAAGRIRIPDLTARPDEIGRLSSALRGMVSALYDRIDSNEQFAADVAHEIKNPLASLRSAVGTLRVAQRPDQREKLLDVIDHDVRRLDRLVSDISNASRLDSELVKEEQESFNLLKMIGNLGEYLGQQAEEKGVEFIMDIPADPITIHGLEARLAQVFVNLITNAISFCEDGDAIRIWARQRDNRVLVVIEDTGPGIPEQALTKVFKRFYSERPENQFGNNSGLGLAISKQIVEAHGGVIWAENIRPTDADPTSEPLGARFVVGLPV